MHPPDMQRHTSMKIVKSKVFIFIFLTLLSCKQRANEGNSGTAIGVSPRESDKNVKIPLSLVKKIESDYLYLKRKDKMLDNQTDAQLLNSIPRKYLSLKVFFAPVESYSALTSPAEVKMQRGGGVVDLSDVFSNEKGQFQFSLKIDWEDLGFVEDDVNRLKVHFISHSKKRNLLNESWGSGCNKYFDVTSFYKSQLETKGIELSLSEQRHLSVLAGTYVFSLFKDDDLYIATLTFVDNRYSKVYCDEIKSL